MIPRKQGSDWGVTYQRSQENCIEQWTMTRVKYCRSLLCQWQWHLHRVHEIPDEIANLVGCEGLQLAIGHQ